LESQAGLDCIYGDCLFGDYGVVLGAVTRVLTRVSLSFPGDVPQARRELGGRISIQTAIELSGVFSLARADFLGLIAG
jgi:hypothetical protein